MDHGVAEQLNRILIESFHSILLDAKLPQKFWAEAVFMEPLTDQIGTCQYVLIGMQLEVRRRPGSLAGRPPS